MLIKQENFSNRLSIYLLFLLTVILPCEADFSALHFDVYNKFENNLPTDSIYHITQDADGFIWVSTYFGFRRFDGIKFESLSELTGQNFGALLDVQIKQLHFDSYGNMWIATIFNGVFRYNKTTGKLHHYNERNQNEFSLTKGFVRWIVEDENKHVWIATNNGLSKFNPNNELMTLYSLKDLGINDNDSGITSFEYSAYDNHIWVGTINGIYIFDSKISRLKPVIANGFEKISNDVITSIHYDGKKILWIGTTGRGLYAYEYEVNKFGLIKSVDKYKLSYIYSIMNDDSGRIWVGTDKELLVLDMESKELVWMLPMANTGSIRNTIFHIFIQKSHIWMASEYSGLWKANLNNFSMSVLQEQNNNSSRENIHTHIIYEDQEKNIWKADSSLGIDVYNYTSKKWSHKNIGELIGNNKQYNIYGITQDLNENIWLETNEMLIKYNLDSKKVSTISFNDYPDNESYFDGMIHMLLDRKNRLWIFSLEHWLSFKDLSTGKFTFFKKEDGIEDRHVNGLFESSDQSIWLATSRGLLKYDEETQKLVKVTIQADSITDPVIQTIAELPLGTLWLGLDAGLMKYETSTGNIKLYTKKDGLSSNNIFGILPDDENIWLATQNGLNRFHHKTAAIDTFYKEDGLPDNEFSNRYTGTGYYKSRSGTLYFPTPKGVAYFNPKDINKNNSPPNVRFTHMKIKGQPVYAENTENSYLKKNLIESQQLQFDYKVKDFELGFAALDYHNPKRNQYKYKLIGYDDDWRSTDYSKRTAAYGNLSPGEYTLHIKASNHHGVWNQSGRQLRINVLPPPWRTWWAYASYALLLILSAYGFYQWRTRQIRQRALLLEQQVKAKTTEITQQNYELETRKGELETQKAELQEKNQHINELIKAKDQIFANISHELKTPLTLITGPLKAITKRAREQREAEELNMIQRNAYRLLRMVDQLLELSKLQQARQTEDNDESLTAHVPLHNIIKSTMPFKHMAADKGIVFAIKENQEALVYCQQDFLEKIILNLVSNAIKYTLEGRIEIFSRWHDEHSVVIEVKDTGMGIPEDKIHSIFDRFTRVHEVENQRKAIAGAGIGLSLVKELVESLSGHIEVKSKLGEGSEFTVYLPAVNVNTPGVNYNPVYLESVENITVEIGVLSEEMQHELEPCTGENHDNVTPPQTESVHEYTILIIDDNADIRHYVTGIFKTTYKVLTASDGSDGITIAESEIPDLIISDVMMPEQDGFHVCLHLKEKEMTCHIPIILLTALHDQDSRLRGLKQHADAYMTKPFDPEELKIQVENLLSLREMMKHSFVSHFMIDNPTGQEGQVCELQNPKDIEFLKKFKKVLSENYTDVELNMLHIASKMALSDRQLQRKIKAVTGKKPVEYLRKYRIDKSLELIKAGRTMEQVSYATGFSTRNYFSNCFRAEMGVTPTQYQKRYLSNKNVTQ